MKLTLDLHYPENRIVTNEVELDQNSIDMIIGFQELDDMCKTGDDLIVRTMLLHSLKLTHNGQTYPLFNENAVVKQCTRLEDGEKWSLTLQTK
jgi:hypothetical protein